MQHKVSIPKKQEYWLGGYFVLFFNPPELFQLEVHILDPDKKIKLKKGTFEYSLSAGGHNVPTPSRLPHNTVKNQKNIFGLSESL